MGLIDLGRTSPLPARSPVLDAPGGVPTKADTKTRDDGAPVEAVPIAKLMERAAVVVGRRRRVRFWEEGIVTKEMIETTARRGEIRKVPYSSTSRLLP